MKATVDLERKNGQWSMVLYAESWILADIIRTMNQQIHPGVFVYASSEHGNGNVNSIHFMTWGGGALGSEPPKDGRKVIFVLKPPSESKAEQSDEPGD